MQEFKKPTAPPELLPRKKAAEYLGVAPHTLAVWAVHRRVALPFIRVGRLVKYRREDLDAFLVANTQNAAPARSMNV